MNAHAVNDPVKAWYPDKATTDRLTRAVLDQLDGENIQDAISASLQATLSLMCENLDRCGPSCVSLNRRSLIAALESVREYLLVYKAVA